jgi:PII-like signaling protein
MKEKLLALEEKHSISEMYCLEEEVPFFVIISEDADMIIKSLEEVQELEADVVVLTEEEKVALEKANSEIGKVVSRVLKEGQRLI